jgi:hypothetical protein
MAQIVKANVAGRFDGFTECWSVKSLPANNLQELMELVRKDED